MQDIDVFVMNLDRSSARRHLINKRFSQLSQKIPFQFFLAVDGKENPEHPLFLKYNAQKRLKYKGSGMTLGQLGCFASHYLLWKKCIELNKPIIVLEDDAILLDNFVKTYNFLNSKENIFEFLWLCESLGGGKSKLVQEYPEYNLSVKRFYKGWKNAACYYITPISAKKLLNYTQEEWVFDVDITMDRYYENKLDFLGILPAIVKQDKSFESHIPTNKGAKNRTLWIKIKREFYTIKDQLKCFLFNLFNN